MLVDVFLTVVVSRAGGCVLDGCCFEGWWMCSWWLLFLGLVVVFFVADVSRANGVFLVGVVGRELRTESARCSRGADLHPPHLLLRGHRNQLVLR